MAAQERPFELGDGWKFAYRFEVPAVLMARGPSSLLDFTSKAALIAQLCDCIAETGVRVYSIAGVALKSQLMRWPRDIWAIVGRGVSETILRGTPLSQSHRHRGQECGPVEKNVQLHLRRASRMNSWPRARPIAAAQPTVLTRCCDYRLVMDDGAIGLIDARLRAEAGTNESSN